MIRIGSQQPHSWTFGVNHLIRIRRDQLAFYEDMRSRFGDIVPLKLGPYKSWLLFHPDPIEELLTEKWSSFIRFRKLTKVVAQWNGDSILLAEGDEWRERRRKVLPAFQSRRLANYGAIAVDHAQRFASDLLSQIKPRGSVTIDTDASMARLTLDIAVSTLFGSDPPENGVEVEQALQILSDTAFRESTSPLTLPDWLPLTSKHRKKWAISVMDDLVVSLVEKGLQRRGQDAGDLLSMLIEQHNRDPHAIRDDSMSLLIAGHETSGALLGWLFFCLARSPDWLERATEEIKSVLQGRLPTIEDLRSLKIISAIVEETLRVYPPAYSLFLRQATTDISLSSTRLSKGDLVQIVPYTLHHDPRWFSNPDVFNPERFLGEPTWPRYSYLPFGAGPRVCIGQNFALIEACLVVATILQRCVPAGTHERSIPNPRFSLRPKGGLPLSWLAA